MDLKQLLPEGDPICDLTFFLKLFIIHVFTFNKRRYFEFFLIGFIQD